MGVNVIPALTAFLRNPLDTIDMEMSRDLIFTNDPGKAQTMRKSMIIPEAWLLISCHTIEWEMQFK